MTSQEHPRRDENPLMRKQPVSDSILSAEVRFNRTRFAYGVNAFVRNVQGLQKFEKPLVVNDIEYPIKPNSLNRETRLGKTALGTTRILRTRDQGFSVCGDGKFEPITFEGNWGEYNVVLISKYPLYANPNDKGILPSFNKERSSVPFCKLSVHEQIDWGDDESITEVVVYGDGSVRGSTDLVDGRPTELQLCEVGLYWVDRLEQMLFPEEPQPTSTN